MKLTIVVLNDFAHVNGGAAQVAISSACALAAHGHRVIFLAAVPPLAKELLQAGVECIALDQHSIANDPRRLRATIQGLWNHHARRVLGDILDTCDPQNTIVHVHGWPKALSSSVVRECRKRNFVVALTLHDYFTACPNGGFFNYRTQQICRLKPMSFACCLEHCDVRSYSQKQFRILRQYVQAKYGGIPRDINGFIAVSQFSRNVLTPYLPPDANIFDIGNPLDVIKGTPAPISDDSPFIFVGRLDPHKGATLLASTAHHISHSLVFVGDGPERQKILQLAPNAKIMGWLPRSQTQQLLRSARALILPSLWYENQPLVILEAAAAGLPTIVPDTSAARDMVENDVTGLWFHGGNLDSLTQCLFKLSDSQIARTIGRAAFERFWQSPPTLEKHVQQLEECYAKLLATNHS